jgi:CheY-like chemotaxis protein
MSRILLVDDSPHAQRMGERILTDEGYEVVTVSNADSALIRLDDVDPDVVIADTVMPGRTGYEICQYLKMNPRHRHVRVILTAGVLEIFDPERAARVEADGALKKPFEASALLAAVRPLAEAATHDRAASPDAADAPASGAAPAPAESLPGGVPFIAVVDAGLIRAAVTVALDASMESMVEQITRRVLANLHSRSAEPRNFQPDMAPLQPETPKPAAPPPPVNPIEPVRRVTPLRIRSGSILGLDLSRPDPPPEIPPDSE